MRVAEHSVGRTAQAGPWRAVLAVLVAGLLVMSSLMGARTAAHAEPVEELTKLTVEVQYDGTWVPNYLDDGPNNGIVASNDKVAFKWVVNGSLVRSGVFTQTLPAGWKWDHASLGSLNSTSSEYQSSYVLSDNGRTVTATISFGDELGNPKLLELSGVVAVPSGSATNESTYTPKVTAVVGGENYSDEATAVKVLNVPHIDLAKERLSNNKQGTYDFGNGPEPAHYADFAVTVNKSTVELGARDTLYQQPLVLQDSFTLSGTNAATARVVPEVVGQDQPQGTVDLIPNGDNAFTLKLTNFIPPTGSVTVRMWVPESDVPPYDKQSLSVANVISSEDIRSTNGDKVHDPEENNKATAAY